ncbi:hypothetical protein CMQ_5130 [Grosmannia clavigera kw1407]|uniref:Uncharacterized protein n=1 Tax=Grosmannia clavigera (strain kw1407 / UAMH 11150) TaxID=655863 RepID=F0XBJ6_GROCL|nr:uncharacterized protein CMQ_5130 [Grosmannia clavigera kw1407]EFX04868.1 hypothetical protein CMQ_5130 [Grosmannia clavigera kw1407]
MPSLVSLDVHWYNLYWDAGIPTCQAAVHENSPSDGSRGGSGLGSISNLANGNTNITAADYLFIRNLEVCRLSGLFVSEKDLVLLLEAIRPSSLFLTHVDLVEGSWGNVFSRLFTVPDSHVTSYTLDDLREHRRFPSYRVIHFNGVRS